MTSARADDGLSPFEHKAMGVVLSLEGLFGIVASGYMLISLLNKKGVDSTQTALRISLALGDLAIGFMCPVVAVASFSETWPFGYSGCQAYAFVANFFGLISIWSLATMVIYRYQAAVPETKKEDLRARYFTILSGIWGVALFWAATPLPIIGWGRYELEPFGTGCLLDFSDRSIGYFIYLIGFTFVGIVLPVGILISFGLKYEGVPIEAVMGCWKAILVLSLYWGCYGITALGTALGGAGSVPLRLFALCPLLAKTCPTINALVFNENTETVDTKEKKKH